MLEAVPPYTTALAFNDRGRAVLKQLKQHTLCINPGESLDHPYYGREKRCGDLYGLFCTDCPEAPALEENRRIYYCKST